jgi:hypothetical protein
MLRGFRHDFTSIDGYDTLTRDPGAVTRGAWFDANSGDLAKLDRAEVGYDRRRVTLQDGLPAWTYFERIGPR